MFELLEKENVGTITLNDKARISDPCYDIDTWCAGTLENVLEGKYNCYYQSVNTGSWGIRIASIEVRHEDYNDVEPIEVQDIDVGVDSGHAGIYDLDYFINTKENKDEYDVWYDRVFGCTYKTVKNPDYMPFEKSKWWEEGFKIIQYYIEEYSSLDTLSRVLALLKEYDGKELTPDEKEYIDKINKINNNMHNDLISKYYEKKNKYLSSIYSRELINKLTADTLDDRCLVSSSGDGDGSYVCLVGRNEDGKIVSIKVDYYYNWDLLL